MVDPKPETPSLSKTSTTNDETTSTIPIPIPTSIEKLAPFNPTSDPIQKIVIRMLSLTEQDVLFDLGCGDGRLLITAAQTIPGLKCIGIEMDPIFTNRAWNTISLLPEQDIKDRIDIREGDALQAAITTTTDATGGAGVDTVEDADTSTNSTPKDNNNTTPPTNNNNRALVLQGRACTKLTLMKDATALYLYIVPKGIAKLMPLIEQVIEQRKKEGRDFRVVSFMFKIIAWEPTAIDRKSKAECPVYLYEFKHSK